MKVFTPFFTDKQKESPLSAPNIEIPQTVETQSESYITDYGDNFSQRSEPTTVSEPVVSKAIQKHSGIDVGNMQDVLDTLNKYGIKYKLTSGKRTKTIGSAGKKSHHLTGNAIDIVPVEGMTWEDFKKQFKTNHAVLDYLKSKGYGILDESTAEMLSKTGGTGAHFHIGPDKIARAGLDAFYAKNGMRLPRYYPGGNLEDIKKEVTDQYRRGSKKLGKLSEELNIFPKSGERISQKIVDLLDGTDISTTTANILYDPNINGAYNQITGDIVVKEDAGRGTVVHELAHASKPELQVERIGQLKRLLGSSIYKYGDQAPSEYLDSEEEIYARLKDTCDRLGIDLSKEYTDDEIEKILLKASKGKTYRYLLEDKDGNRSIQTITLDENGKATSTPSPKGAKIIESSSSQVFENDKNFLNRYSPRFIKSMIKDLVSTDKDIKNIV